MFHVNNWSVDPWIETDTHYSHKETISERSAFQRRRASKRLVVLGASSAHGSNELMEDSFAGIVNEQTEWDVVNLGIGGTTSAGLVSLIPYVEQCNRMLW